MNAKRPHFDWWHEFVLITLLVTLACAAAIVMPQFLELKGQIYLSRTLWAPSLLALGMTLIIITGGIDLSVGSLVGLCCVAYGMTYEASGSVLLSTLICMTTGLIGGAINGGLVAGVNIHPLIVTLATHAAFRGIAEGITQGRPYPNVGGELEFLISGSVFGIPYAAIGFGLLASVFAVFASRTPPGRYLYAIGHNEIAARFSGVPVARIRCGLYMTSGLLASLAALLFLGKFGTAKADNGSGYELAVITAVVVGGTSIFGGRGNIGGTILGLLLIHETHLFISRYWRSEELKEIVTGLLLILAVLLFRFLSRSRRE